jgi:hypothetical protein
MVVFEIVDIVDVFGERVNGGVNRCNRNPSQEKKQFLSCLL